MTDVRRLKQWQPIKFSNEMRSRVVREDLKLKHMRNLPKAPSLLRKVKQEQEQEQRQEQKQEQKQEQEQVPKDADRTWKIVMGVGVGVAVVAAVGYYALKE